ncbi:hypothetical protein DWB68_10275 [Galactobacter valiniphilus]|uniref:Uncharacterized protein n=1 Tax=Galactobacter valiniphilus TaxID=2676122 RepID=A0A399J8K2_9MICC|nr:hypothetical protein [Galactobacter valiniphilus]RII41903.1 hypothetical protein DWB68_10275 [Galactobacter valiniphilus]
MTNQTPSTEDVRYGYRTGVTAPILPVEAGDAFDAWLAARDREVAAKARAQELRDVADWLFDTMEGPLMCTDKCGDPKCADDIRINFASGLQRSLRARADRIGAGDE